jgi:hypothetical protein
MRLPGTQSDGVGGLDLILVWEKEEHLVLVWEKEE